MLMPTVTLIIPVIKRSCITTAINNQIWHMNEWNHVAIMITQNIYIIMPFSKSFQNSSASYLSFI